MLAFDPLTQRDSLLGNAGSEAAALGSAVVRCVLVECIGEAKAGRMFSNSFTSWI